MAIILDTCVVSEPTRLVPDPRVREWMTAQSADSLYITATVVGEIADGIERMQAGARRSAFETWLDRLIAVDFANRILPFDTAAARLYGRLIAGALAQGRPSQMGDAQIAAVARKHGMAVATRNLRDFEVFGIPLLDPWRGA
ncbi:type II toxin-antitoxin system VapC family toxin [Azospirillum sp. RWY-5-1]|uniref:Ribonuclease VapC n=1 Tax=Azospirillum oleiclasticum TaxID=2735135 RepID=A0ABX2TBQ8_9PROT|nr:type II toxin-antitoxin system VapC family toxin [Azospirillum oleiclasticum]NYZ13442.1 type II toxin-antitoxin system VapC family toxin [Azospirillum oleiclasticum]NYZ20603.1 type II toxin-antitoxin system VapC family toxin [Azospirillum oleiclasticum]